MERERDTCRRHREDSRPTRDEAERIASQTFEQWKTRGGEEEDRDGRAATYVGATFALGALGLVALITLVVWLFA
jgi:hypothetical protein